MTMFPFLLLINYITSFLIQDVKSERYAKFTGTGALMTLTDTISDATQWEAIQVEDNPTILAIQKQGTESCLDNAGGLGMVMVTPFLKKKTQKFKLNLSEEGNYNIVQDDRLYMFYDVTATSFKMGRNIPANMRGFRFVSDDGSRAWPGHILTQHKWL